MEGAEDRRWAEGPVRRLSVSRLGDPEGLSGRDQAVARELGAGRLDSSLRKSCEGCKHEAAKIFLTTHCLLSSVPAEMGRKTGTLMTPHFQGVGWNRTLLQRAEQLRQLEAGLAGVSDVWLPSGFSRGAWPGGQIC